MSRQKEPIGFQTHQEKDGLIPLDRAFIRPEHGVGLEERLRKKSSEPNAAREFRDLITPLISSHALLLLPHHVFF